MTLKWTSNETQMLVNSVTLVKSMFGTLEKFIRGFRKTLLWNRERKGRTIFGSQTESRKVRIVRFGLEIEIQQSVQPSMSVWMLARASMMGYASDATSSRSAMIGCWRLADPPSTDHILKDQLYLIKPTSSWIVPWLLDDLGTNFFKFEFPHSPTISHTT